MKIRVVILAVALVGVALAGCKKKNHKILASKVDPTIWTIDEMYYVQHDDANGGAIMHDTVLQSVGRFEFLHDKNRFKHGTGTLYRREYEGAAWGIESQQNFTWSIDDDDLQITYQDGHIENVDIIESRRKKQHWRSRSDVETIRTERTYFLSKSFDD